MGLSKAEGGVKIIIRIPLIGGVNDDAGNMEATARYVVEHSGEKKELNLLPYHKIAQTKYQKLGRLEEFRLLEGPTREAQTRAVSTFKQLGLEASIGG